MNGVVKRKGHRCRLVPAQRYHLFSKEKEITRVLFSCWCGKSEMRHYDGRLDLGDIIAGVAGSRLELPILSDSRELAVEPEIVINSQKI
ncbi:MAG: hypothetical protein M1352_03540 [Patescibacteria group bacterium]|nr:hypothetical protein [Patescibacteria group bacterium]